MQTAIVYITTPTGVRAEYRSIEARGTFTHSVELKFSPTGANRHCMPIMRRGASGRASGIYATLDGILRNIQTASQNLLEPALVQRPEILVELIQHYDGLSGHEKVRAIEIARQLPDAIRLARKKKRESGRRAA